MCEKITDGTHDTPQRLDNGIKFITGKHIRPFFVDYENSDYVSEEVHKEIFKRCNPEFGDVLYTNIGAGIGNAAINIVSYEFSMKNVALLKVKKDIINGYYLEYYLNNEKIKERIIENYSNGGAQRFLSLKSITKILSTIPPLPLQQKFAEKIESIEKHKQIVNVTIKDLETLLASRMQFWFE
ncbi:MAG: restriction endonuclease subunit S [Bacteroidales bacterium]|nr:restriction endonuclease subunit S [Bacteroidales bacterium]